MMLSKTRRKALLGSETSRRNKLALYASYVAESERVEYKWVGQPYESRLAFRFEGQGDFLVAKSWDEDILSKMKSGQEK